MRQSILFYLFFLLWSIVGIAQQNENPVILMATQGKISYQAPGYSNKKPIAGAVFKNIGTITLKPNSSATFLTGGQLQTIQGPQTTALKEVFGDNSGLVKINFERSFGEYSMAALDLAANAQDAKDAWGTVVNKKGSGDGWGTVVNKKGSGDGWGPVVNKKGSGDGWGTVVNKKGSGDGWGGKGNNINGIVPFGKIRPGSKLFQWSKPAGAQNFQLEIKSSKGELIHKANVQDTFLILDLDPAKFKEGQQYVWVVTSGGVQSNPLVFEIGTSQSLISAQQKAEMAESYAKAPSAVQGLMRAVALEQGEWHNDAAQTYQDLQQKEPNNLLLKLMHAAFWMRNGPKPVAEKAFRGR